MGPMLYECAHCGRPVRHNVGRGLCRHCWDNPKIRVKYAIRDEFPAKGPRRKMPAPAPAPPRSQPTYADIEKMRRQHFRDAYVPAAPETTEGEE